MRTGRLVITGANGNLGRRLLTALAGRGSVRALVRSEGAAAKLRQLPGDHEVLVVDYLDPVAVGAALDGAWAVVHLVGIIKEPRAGAYYEAHEATAKVLAAAAQAQGVNRIVYLSILGSDPGAGNACLASKGAAERLLLEAAVTTRVLRVPMVLGEGDYASAALANRARRRLSFVFRGASLEQPIYAGDVIRAVIATLEDAAMAGGAMDLAGPESLSRRALTRRAARSLGRSTRVVSLPLAVGMALAWTLQRLLAPPPVTTAMLGVLDHDDAIDPLPASRALGLALTSLDEMLATCLTPSKGAGYPT
jgi:NADH dehydrogenase